MGVLVGLRKMQAVVVNDAVIRAHVVPFHVFDLGPLKDTLHLVEGGEAHLARKEHLCQTPHILRRSISRLHSRRIT